MEERSSASEVDRGDRSGAINLRNIGFICPSVLILYPGYVRNNGLLRVEMRWCRIGFAPDKLAN